MIFLDGYEYVRAVLLLVLHSSRVSYMLLRRGIMGCTVMGVGLIIICLNEDSCACLF